MRRPARATIPARVRFAFLIPVISVLMAGMLVTCLRAESCADNLTPQTVILDRFEARDATVADVLEALTLVAEKVSKRNYRPNLVIIGDAIGQMKVSLDLKDAPLSDALDRIGELPGVEVTYRSHQTVIFSLRQG